ncbi:MAG: hypothetical protein E6J34_18390 [Chloroflexi bacterium]|nr:MAG: hypothetical protein E6J34_18390 [Chloroflexota bacterium]
MDELMETIIDEWIKGLIPILLPGATVLEKLDPVIDTEVLRAARNVKHVYLVQEQQKNVFEQLLEQDEWVLKQKALSEQEGFAKALRKSLITVVQTLYPSLVELAEQNAISIQEIDALRLVIRQILGAPDEATARFLLNSLS